MKRKLLIVFGLLLMAATVSTGTLAYTAIEGTARNAITSGNIKLEIREKTDTGEDFSTEGVLIMPGDTVSKIVTIENTGAHPMYLRVQLIKGVNDESLSAESCIDMDINTTDWTYKDGYYYYNTVLAAGESTKALMTEAYIDGWAVGNDFLGKELTLEVVAEAVQSEHNGATVWEASGWNEAVIAE